MSTSQECPTPRGGNPTPTPPSPSRIPHSFSDSHLSSALHSTSGLLSSLMQSLTGKSSEIGGKAVLSKSVSHSCLTTTAKPTPSISLAELEKVMVIGTGTFSKVYLVKRNSEFYAMKVVPKKRLQNIKQASGILSEKDILLSISHEYIVKMYATFQDADNLYMLMEFAQGGELFYHLRDSGTFSEERTRFYAAEIVMALECLHSRGIIYRDLKLENIVLAASGHIRLTDFGFARKLATTQSRTFTICGTAEYLAPELLLGGGYRFSVDWWALGVLIFEMLSGYSPFYEQRNSDMYKRILNGKVPFPPFITGHAKTFVKGLLRRDHTKRLGCGEEGVAEIKNHPWFEGFDWDAPTPPFVPPLSHSGDTSFFQVEIDEGEFDDLHEPKADGSPSMDDGASEKGVPDYWFEGF